MATKGCGRDDFDDKIGCSSCWKKLGIIEIRLASFTYYHWHFCAALRKFNGLTRYTNKAISGVSAGRSSRTYSCIRTCLFVPWPLVDVKQVMSFVRR
eukprot:3695329-Pleurochrysis_carterae.AAC.1